MTILIYSHVTKQFLVDSCYSWTNGRRPMSGSKIANHKGYLYSATGATTDRPWAIKIIEALDKGEFVVPDLPKGEYLEIAIRTPLGEPFMVQKSDGSTTGLICSLINSPHDWCAGSGGGFYSAYRAMGETPESAIEMTARFHSECGLPISQF